MNNKEIDEFNNKNTPQWYKNKLVSREKLEKLADKCKECKKILEEQFIEDLCICIKCNHIYIYGNECNHNHKKIKED